MCLYRVTVTTWHVVEWVLETFLRWKHQHQPLWLNKLSRNQYLYISVHPKRKEEMNENNEWRNICFWKYFWGNQKGRGVRSSRNPVRASRFSVFLYFPSLTENSQFLARCFLYWKSGHRVGGRCLVCGGGLIRFPCQGIPAWPTCIQSQPVQGGLKWSVKCLFAIRQWDKHQERWGIRRHYST